MRFAEADEKRVQITHTHTDRKTDRHTGKHLTLLLLIMAKIYKHFGHATHVRFTAQLLGLASWEKCSPTGYEIFEKLIHVRPQRVRYDTIFKIKKKHTKTQNTQLNKGIQICTVCECVCVPSNRLLAQNKIVNY